MAKEEENQKKKQPKNNNDKHDDDDDEMMDYNEILSGKVILITGANRGIGKSFVDVLLEKCTTISKIYAVVRNIDSLKSQAIINDDPRVVPLYMDLSKPETIIEASKISTDVQIVINNAGVLLRTKNLLDKNETITNLQTEFDVNVFGLLHLAQQYIPILIKNNNNNNNESSCCCCWFIQINSVASFRCGYYDVATYSASKAASYSITQAIQQQINLNLMTNNTDQEGNNNNNNNNNNNVVQVISVHPGPIATDMMLSSNDTKLIQQSEDPKIVVEEVLKAMLKKNEQEELSVDKKEEKEAAEACSSSSSNKIIHVFPDKKSKNLYSNVLEPYIKTVIEDGKMYG